MSVAVLHTFEVTPLVPAVTEVVTIVTVGHAGLVTTAEGAETHDVITFVAGQTFISSLNAAHSRHQKQGQEHNRLHGKESPSVSWEACTPDYAENLQTNTRRLTTPFDIYETLFDILHFNEFIPVRRGFKNRGISLFREIPEDRGCEEAGILPHWCTCAEFQTLSPTNEIVQKVANNMIKEINIQLNEVSKRCAFLRLGKIKNAIKLLPSEKVLRFEESKNDVINRFVKYGDRSKAQVNYQLTFSTVPGNALFEATMQFDERDDSYKMISDISRINEYGHQGDCIDVHKLRKFCYCKS